jgi:PIN domain nuclease of toxin-antitoxin system
MRYLLDTQLLLWAAAGSSRLSLTATTIIEEPENELLFSPISLWEIAIKNGLGREDFRVEPRRFRQALLDHGYQELVLTSEHAASIDSLPRLQSDPFDRMLIAQATVEGVTLLTADDQVARYPGPIEKV